MYLAYFGSGCNIKGTTHYAQYVNRPFQKTSSFPCTGGVAPTKIPGTEHVTNSRWRGCCIKKGCAEMTTDHRDNTQDIPSRPPGHRSEPPPHTQHPHFNVCYCHRDHGHDGDGDGDGWGCAGVGRVHGPWWRWRGRIQRRIRTVPCSLRVPLGTPHPPCHHSTTPTQHHSTTTTHTTSQHHPHDIRRG